MVDVASFDELRAKVEAARLDYRDALEAQREMFRGYSGLPQPDGMQHLHQVGERMRQAQLRYSEAVDALSKYVLERGHRSGLTYRATQRTMRVEILLVDDDIAECHMFREIAAQRSEQEIKMLTATNCTRALEVLSKDELTLNLVIADLSVLEFGGIELVKRCEPRGIPVVIFSGSENPEHEAEALRLGARQFVRKPNDLDAYADAVWTIISTWARPSAS